jgi:predicted PurR-regulated permease PerM
MIEPMIHLPGEERWTLTAIALVSIALVAVLVLHLTPALIAGMLVYTLGRRLTQWIERRTHLPHPGALSVAILIALIVGAGSIIVERAAETAAKGAGSEAIFNQMATSLDQLRTTLPAWLAAHVPASLDALRTSGVTWLREHAPQVQLWGRNTLRGVTYVLAGGIVGALAVL